MIKDRSLLKTYLQNFMYDQFEFDSIWLKKKKKIGSVLDEVWFPHHTYLIKWP